MSANKAKGTKWEVDLVGSVGAFTLSVPALCPRRVAQEGFLDTGDIHGIEPFIGQAKNWRSWQDAMREGLDGAEAQKVRAGQPYGVAFVKRANKGTGKGYAVMTVETFTRFLVEYHRAMEVATLTASNRAKLATYLDADKDRPFK